MICSNVILGALMKRLHVLIPDWTHKKLWKIARLRNITLSRYVNRALLRYILDEQKYEESDESKQIDVMS